MFRNLTFTLVLSAAFPLLASAQAARSLALAPDPGKPLLTVETSCGECQFGLPGQSCDVAVRLPQEDGTNKAFFVDGVGISEYGHPHDKNGFCMQVRTAEVQGELVDGRFKTSYFKLLPLEKGKQKDKDRDGKEKNAHH
jgi:hypothetical protein